MTCNPILPSLQDDDLNDLTLPDENEIIKQERSADRLTNQLLNDAITQVSLAPYVVLCYRPCVCVKCGFQKGFCLG